MGQKDIILERTVLYSLEKRVVSMRLALCDDDRQLIKELKPLIDQYGHNHRFEMVIDVFHCGEALLKSKQTYDMIFLDYRLEGIDGLSAAKTLRSRNINCAIIFITGYPRDFVYQSFAVNPFRFHAKPLEHSKLYETLDDFFKMYGHDYPILLHHNREYLQIYTRDIVFLEAMNKHCIIHLKDEQLHIAKTMTKINDLLPQSHFYRVGRAYIINFNHIAKYNNYEVFFKNGAKVHVSRKFFALFKKAFRDYSDLHNPKRPERKH